MDSFDAKFCLSSQQSVNYSEYGDIIIFDVDKNIITTPYDDINVLPNEIVSSTNLN